MRLVGVAALAAWACFWSAPADAGSAKGAALADVVKVNQITETFAKAALAKDWATLAGLYLEDAVLDPPNEPAAKGRAAIRAWFERFPPMTAFTLNNVTVEGRDDMAYVHGTYTLTIAPPGAPGPIKDSGKYLEIRRRQPDGRWLIAVDIFNSDLPPAAPPR